MDRLYLKQKLSLLAESLASINCVDGTVLDVDTSVNPRFFGHPNIQSEAPEYAEDHTLKLSHY